MDTERESFWVAVYEAQHFFNGSRVLVPKSLYFSYEEGKRFRPLEIRPHTELP